MFKLAHVFFLLLAITGAAFAEQMKFIGVFHLPDNDIQLVLNCTLTRPNATSNYTLAGTIKSDDGNYTVSGTGYYKNGKIKGYARRGTGNTKFEQPLDGTIGPNAQTINVTCLLLSPKTKVAMQTQFKGIRQQDTGEDDLIPVYVRTTIGKSSQLNHMSIDFDKGTGTVGSFIGNGAEQRYPIRFSPVPKAIAFGAKWEFWLDASAVPKDAVRGFKMSANYIDGGARTPYIDFEMGRGTERVFRKTITWSMKDGFDMTGIYFNHDSAEYLTVYFKLQQMKRGDFNRLVGASNTTPVGLGGSTTNPTVPKPPTTTNPPKPPAHPTQLSTGTVKGDVVIRLPNKSEDEPLRPGMVLPPKTMIDVDPDSSATFQLPNGATLLLRGGTRMTIEELTPTGGQARIVVRMMMGEILYRHTRDAAANIVKGDFVIKINESVTSSRGTEFSLKFDPNSGMMTLNLTDGQVEFDPGHGLEKMLLDAPTVVTLSARGS